MRNEQKTYRCAMNVIEGRPSIAEFALQLKGFRNKVARVEEC